MPTADPQQAETEGGASLGCRAGHHRGHLGEIWGPWIPVMAFPQVGSLAGVG